MLISSKIRRLDMLFAGVEMDYDMVDKAVLKESLIILDRYVLPVAHATIKKMDKPKSATAIIEDMKLVIADVVFEIQEANNILTPFKLRLST